MLAWYVFQLSIWCGFLFHPIGTGSVSTAPGTVLSVQLVLQEGDIPAGIAGLAVTQIRSPFTDGTGKVGFTGTLSDGMNTDGFVWYDSGIVFVNSSVMFMSGA